MLLRCILWERHYGLGVNLVNITPHFHWLSPPLPLFTPCLFCVNVHFSVFHHSKHFGTQTDSTYWHRLRVLSFSVSTLCWQTPTELMCFLYVFVEAPGPPNEGLSAMNSHDLNTVKRDLFICLFIGRVCIKWLPKASVNAKKGNK